MGREGECVENERREKQSVVGCGECLREGVGFGACLGGGCCFEQGGGGGWRAPPKPQRGGVRHKF